ncbi:MAG: hypothetical protein JRC86_02480 [Deltaproteobacteria bacterium]|nr:hypothetical protein [Deltaproteobacteria bacterium]
MDGNASLFETGGIVTEVPLVLPEAEGFSMRQLTALMVGFSPHCAAGSLKGDRMRGLAEAFNIINIMAVLH